MIPPIVSIYYADPVEPRIVVTLEDGAQHFMYWPSGTWKDKHVQDWLDEGNTITPYSQPLTTNKGEKQAAINENYRLAEAQPITLGANDFDASVDALVEIMSVYVAVQGGYILPGNFTWIAVDGTLVPADAAKVKLLHEAISIKHYQDAHNYASLTKQVKAATTVAEVDAIPDW